MVLGGIRRGMATTAQLISGLNGWLPFKTSSLSLSYISPRCQPSAAQCLRQRIPLLGNT